MKSILDFFSNRFDFIRNNIMQSFLLWDGGMRRGAHKCHDLSAIVYT